ncbi:MAG: beta-ketoacyl-ACP synthase II [Candidatus Hydrogenedentota bacterium]
MRTRVVVTGTGVVSPVGNDTETFWKSICEGRPGIRRIDYFDPSELPSQIAGQTEHCVPPGMTSKDIRRSDQYSVWALCSALQAWEQAGVDLDKEDPMRCGVTMGSGIGGLFTFQEQMNRFLEGGARRVSPLTIPKLLANIGSGEVAIRLGLQGPNEAVVSACATGAQSIGDAAMAIRNGRADVMVAGGAEASIVPFGMASFSAMKALSCRNDEPERASRPFDRDRDGFVMGEGGGALVLESEEHARKRGAEILGEIAGMADTCDAYHITAPRPDGSCASGAMRLALEDANVEPSAIGYFNAHGTSTKLNDAAETLALKTVFGEAMPPVSSTKSMIGHLLGAAGAVEALACLLAVRDGVLPPSINYDTPDPECDINIVANEAREARIDFAMSNSLGFGGHNSSLVIARYE